MSDYDDSECDIYVGPTTKDVRHGERVQAWDEDGSDVLIALVDRPADASDVCFDGDGYGWPCETHRTLWVPKAHVRDSPGSDRTAIPTRKE